MRKWNAISVGHKHTNTDEDMHGPQCVQRHDKARPEQNKVKAVNK